GGLVQRRLRGPRPRAGAGRVCPRPDQARAVQLPGQLPAAGPPGRAGCPGGTGRGMTFRYPMLVRWSDIDSYDHVNNVRYFDYFQEARIAFLAGILDTVAEGYFDAYPVVLAHQSVNYLRPIL